MKLSDIDFLVLRKTPERDAYWTSDIAYDARLTTTWARRSLERLALNGLVEVVAPGGKGYPASWRRTDAGRAALAEEKQ